MPACTFFGHREVQNSGEIKEKLNITIRRLIENDGVTTFYVGNNGSFDRLVLETLREVSKEYKINYTVVLAYINFNKEYYDSFINGYLSEMADKLTQTEKDLLPYAPLVMTYELAIRFLDDYLNMDEYFGVVNEDDNLVRARVQMKLLEEMENNFEYIYQSTSNALQNQSQF